MLGAEHRPRRHVVRRHQALARHLAHRQLALRRALDSVAEGGLHLAHRAHERGELGGQERGLMIGAGQAPVQREVLLDAGGAASGRRDGDRQAQRVVREPHGRPEDPRVGVHDAQVGEARIRGVIAHALEHGQIGEPGAPEGPHGRLHLVHVRHAGGEEDGKPE
jgi:hypothetical protein